MFTDNQLFRCVNVYLDNQDDIALEPRDYFADRPCTSCFAPQTLCTSEMTRCPTILFALLMRFDLQGKNCKTVHLTETITTKNNTKYELVAVVNHIGNSSESGHYTATISRGASHMWFTCDDNNVSITHYPEFSKEAYVLMYKMLPS